MGTLRAFLAGVAPRSLPNAQVAELVDALVSGTSGAIRGGSSPLLGTIYIPDKTRYSGLHVENPAKSGLSMPHKTR